MQSRIPFNKPYFTGQETAYIEDAVKLGKISGDGPYTKKCHQFFEEKYGFKKCLLTTSCTDALEMTALLMDLKEGDEVIVPSYTFVSTANAFALRGAKIVFADSRPDHPNVDIDSIRELITPKTKAIVVVHYAGMACEMNELMTLVEKHELFLVEDAAQAVDSYYHGKALGSFGHFATFSFHETKNIMSGEGGMLVINDERFFDRAEIIREKGTNRSAFFRGEVDKYNWVDLGSSFLPSDIIAAILYAQLQELKRIQNRRIEHWNKYHELLAPIADRIGFSLPEIPDGATNNAHMYYIVWPNIELRDRCTQLLKDADVQAVFHYLSLHKSPYFKNQYSGKKLPNSDFFSNGLLRLPLFFELPSNAAERVSEALIRLGR